MSQSLTPIHTPAPVLDFPRKVESHDYDFIMAKLIFLDTLVQTLPHIEEDFKRLQTAEGQSVMEVTRSTMFNVIEQASDALQNSVILRGPALQSE